MYIYECHLGGLYTSDIELDFDELYCEQCGDSDWLVGYADTREEAWELLKDDTATFDLSECDNCEHDGDEQWCIDNCEGYQHSGGYSYDYVQEFLNENWDE